MKSKIILLICLVTAPLKAGNEAGANWIANRFRARAYDLLSDLCRLTGTAQQLLDSSSIERLEQAIVQTPLLVKEACGGGTAAEVQLDGICLLRPAWSEFFDRKMDVGAEVYAIYLEVLGEADTRRIENFQAVRFPAGPAQFQQNEISWLIFPGVFSRAQAVLQCQELNGIKLYSSLNWTLPSDKLERRSLTQDLTRLVYQTPGMYGVWLSEGWINLSTEPLVNFGRTGPELHGLICEGRERPR